MFTRTFQLVVALMTLLLTIGCVSVCPTVANDASLPFVELDGYKFHVRTFGDPSAPPVIVLHGGPGGDLKYLLPIQDLAKDHFVIYYDQRGTGLSPRVAKEDLTIESSLDDLHRLVAHYGQQGKVRLIGHSWGAMLVIAYVGQHPERVSHVVAVEPGILTPTSAVAFVSRLKASQSVWDALPMLGYILQSPFVTSVDGHERFDYVMTRMMNRNKPGGPYQCPGQAMTPDAFARGGYASFANMLKPLFNDPAAFHYDLTQGTNQYRGGLLMISSECSFIGYKYQEEFHLRLLPPQTKHVLAKGMGHNMLTLNPQWSVGMIRKFMDTSTSRVGLTQITNG